MRAFRFRSAVQVLGVALALTVATPLVQQVAHSQAVSQNGGSIQGSITDPSGAAIPGARITVSNSGTGFSRVITADSAGLYTVGPLPPGNYTITVEATGFDKTIVKTIVQTGTVSSGSVKLKVGTTGETVEVDAGAVQINTDQIGVAGVVSTQQLDTLPVNGRNVLDAAQLQPGVILESGMDFDPTKAGYSALSVSGVGGRTTRILLDGQDITDETVGTTIYNVPTGAVGELQLNRSTQDVSGEVTSTGQVLEVTRSGTNKFHGNAFYNFQDNNAGFASIEDAPAPFQRNQYGGYVGGPILKDRLFFYGGGERIQQAEQDVAIGYDPAFTALAQQYPFTPTPYKDNFSFARLDYNAPHGINLFVRGVYSVNAADSTFGYAPYSLYENRDNVYGIVGGADFTSGKFTHSFRYGYEKFHNILGDGTGALGSSIYNPSNVFGFPVTLEGSLNAGPNYLAPQGTFQSDKQFHYDGTWTKGKHNLKYGFELNRLLNGGFAEFFGASLFTEISTSVPNTDANGNPACGDVLNSGPCLGDPLKGYTIDGYVLGNGNGFFSERPGFGLAGGGDPSWRFAAYVGDTWKVLPYLTITAGVRWSVDTDRANQDLASPTCGEVDPSLQWSGCNSSNGSAYLFDQYEQGLGGKVHQPYANFGPQLGLVFSPGDHKTSFRLGIGYYYDSNVFNNTGNSRPEVVTAKGPYFGDTGANYQGVSVNLPGYGAVTAAPDGTPVSTIMNESIYHSVPEMEAILQEWQAKVKGADAANPSYIGSAAGYALNADNIYAKPYLSPYSLQVNGGVQREIRPGLIVSADFVHSSIFKVPISIDVNHSGAARTLNTTAAQNAIAATLANNGWASIDDAIKAGASITDFAENGLDSSAVYTEGYAPAAFGLTPDTAAAFGGTNPNVGQGLFILPVGKSGYDALQVVVQQQKRHPLPGITNSNFQASYSLSRSINDSKAGVDQFFGGYGPYDNDDTNKYLGRTALDHTNELSFGGSFGVKYGPQIGLIGHFFSAPATTLTVDTEGNSVGEIFQTDFDGDGTYGDILPGTDPGDYMHAVKGKGLNNYINSYNAKYAGQLTPAGEALVAAGLFTAKQMQQLGAVAPTLATQPDNNPRNNPAFRTFDANITYPIHLKFLGEGTVITPGVAFYNLFNLANFGGPGGTVLAVGDQEANQVNGPNTWAVANTTSRTTRNSGTFDQGGPRSAEFNLKIEF